MQERRVEGMMSPVSAREESGRCIEASMCRRGELKL